MASTEKKIRKGGLARINEAAAFTTESGGSRRYPHDNWDSDERRIIQATYRLSLKQQQAWRDRKREQIKEARAKGEDTFSIAFDDAGESRLPPQNGYVELQAGKIYPVLRARMQAHIGYHVRPGYMMVLDTDSGYEVMVPRKFMEAV